MQKALRGMQMKQGYNNEMEEDDKVNWLDIFVYTGGLLCCKLPNFF